MRVRNVNKRAIESSVCRALEMFSNKNRMTRQKKGHLIIHDLDLSQADQEAIGHVASRRLYSVLVF